MKKKGQLKIQQMAFMLVAVTLFFALVGLFILTIGLSKIKNSAVALEDKNALLLVTKLANSPEFSCGESFGSDKGDCVDADKVMMLKKNINDYLGFWGVSNIEVRIIYPAGTEKDCTLGNYPDCNVIKLRDNEITTSNSNFVSVCRKDANNQNKCEVGEMIISYGK